MLTPYTVLSPATIERIVDCRAWSQFPLEDMRVTRIECEPKDLHRHIEELIKNAWGQSTCAALSTYFTTTDLVPTLLNKSGCVRVFYF